MLLNTHTVCIIDIILKLWANSYHTVHTQCIVHDGAPYSSKSYIAHLECHHADSSLCTIPFDVAIAASAFEEIEYTAVTNAAAGGVRPTNRETKSDLFI